MILKFLILDSRSGPLEISRTEEIILVVQRHLKRGCFVLCDCFGVLVCVLEDRVEVYQAGFLIYQEFISRCASDVGPCGECTQLFLGRGPKQAAGGLLG